MHPEWWQWLLAWWLASIPAGVFVGSLIRWGTAVVEVRRDA